MKKHGRVAAVVCAMVIQQTPDLDPIAVIARLHQRPNVPQELLDIRD